MALFGVEVILICCEGFCALLFIRDCWCRTFCDLYYVALSIVFFFFILKKKMLVVEVVIVIIRLWGHTSCLLVGI